MNEMGGISFLEENAKAKPGASPRVAGGFAPGIPPKNFELRLFNFVDPHEFLISYYEQRKSKQSSFSYSKWAQELKFNNRSFLRLLILGQRNFTDNSILKFINYFKFKNSEADYFSNIIKLKQATKVDEREYFASKVQKKVKGLSIDKKSSFDFLSSLVTPRVLTLLGEGGFEKKTTARIADQLQISKSEVEKSLVILEKIGMAVSEDAASGYERTWAATAKVFSVDDSLGSLALQIYHKMALEEAISAISMPPEKRDFRSAVLSISKSQYLRFVDDVNSFLFELIEKYKNLECDEPRVLVQLNSSVITVSQEFGGSNEIRTP